MTFPNRALRGYQNLPYPRICTTNSMGNGGNVNGGSGGYTPETYRRFLLNIATAASVNPVALKQADPENICLFYQAGTAEQVDAITTGNPITAGQKIWPGWWLTSVGTSLAASLAASGGTGQSMTLTGQPAVGFFGSQVCTLNTAITSTGSQSATFTGVPRADANSTWATLGSVGASAYQTGASVIVDSGSNFEVVTITVNSVTAQTITFTANFTKTHAAGCYIGLLPFAALITNATYDGSRQIQSTAEVVVVTGQTGPNTYTINRGTTGSPVWNTPYGSATNPPAHAVGDRVAAVVVANGYITTHLLNPTAYCPVCPLTTGTPNQNNMRWGDYFAYLVQQTIGSYTFTDPEGVTRNAYDGVFIDSCNWVWNPQPPWADADSNNGGDALAGDGPSPGPLLYTNNGSALQGQAFSYGVANGVRYILRALRNLQTNAPLAICTNGSFYPLLADGIYWENMGDDFSNPKTKAKFLYRLQAQAGVHPAGTYSYPVVIYNYDLNNSNNLAGSETSTNNGMNGKPVYQVARLYLAAVTAMTDGFFCCDWGDAHHGQTWMLDEYDGGQGTCLTAALTTAATSLTTQTNPGWSVGTYIHVPADYSASAPNNLAEDEVMQVSGAITGSTGSFSIPVSRGIPYNGVTQTKCVAQVGAKVFTAAQSQAGKGWLGRALEAGTNQLSSLGSNLLLNGDFATATPGTGTPPFGATFTHWSVSNTAAGFDAGHAYSGYAMVDTVVYHSSPQSLRFYTGVPYFQQYGFDLTLAQTVTGTYGAGTPWTFSFWAKGDHGQTLGVFIKDNTNNSTLENIYLPITPQWTQYWLVGYIGGVASSSLTCQIGFAGNNGSVWIDDCALQSGDPNVFQRDFANGYVICNATNSPYTATLPNPPTNGFTQYQYISGSQVPSINNGNPIGAAQSWQVTVPANDGIFLKKV